MRRRRPVEDQDDLFAQTVLGPQPDWILAGMAWPEPGRFLVNHRGARVRERVWADLTTSNAPLVIAGWASIDQVIRLVAAARARPDSSSVRVLLGAEPFESQRAAWPSAATFTADARDYWNRQGVSILLSAQVLQAVEALDAGWFRARFLPGRPRMHAKVYVGDTAATLGSSNFTEAGLSRQIEANIRFDKAANGADYESVRLIAENYWDVGQPWDGELRSLLLDMAKVVSWQEALARACAALLEGHWADLDLGQVIGSAGLWPHQRSGIAQALWVLENVGSVLVADPTGSGKTRMGAHLIRAARDRLLTTGRIRDGLCTMVCPRPVKPAWEREALACRLPLHTVSDGLLSRKATTGRRVEEEQVARAQILAVDEGHRYLNQTSNRAQQVGASSADHAIIFTATPINRQAEDLLALVDLLGADNFPDDLLSLLRQLNRRKGREPLTGDQQDLIRGELQRFIVRRTKAQLNQHVEDHLDEYRDRDTGRLCRYPQITPHRYATGETPGDRDVAARIRDIAREIRGITDLSGGTPLTMPDHLALRMKEEDYLGWRLMSAQGLAGYRLASAMRSSRAALLEHLVGTSQACLELEISEGLVRKPEDTGNVVQKLREAQQAAPPVHTLKCDLPDWLTNIDAWRAECEREIDRYDQVLQLARRLTSAREQRKADLIRQLLEDHERVLVFEHAPITAAVIKTLVNAASPGMTVVLATGTAAKQRQQVEHLFSPASNARAIAICTDAMNEGLNLQGASTMVHLDYPTTLRVAEQRVGRIVRMDSRHDRIQTWWPDDSDEFKLRRIELLHRRQEESAALIGGNLDLPTTADADQVVDPEPFIEHERTLSEAATWEGIASALDPVRSVVTGDDALVPARTYAAYRTSQETVRSRVSVVPSTKPWAFFAIESPGSGAPRWMLLDQAAGSPHVQIETVTQRLRGLLRENPPSIELGGDWEHWMAHFLREAVHAERGLLPMKLQRALTQMHGTCRGWAEQSRAQDDHDSADRWEAVAALAKADLDGGPSDPSVDLYQVANLWLGVVQLLREEARATPAVRRRRYSLLSDIDPILRTRQLPLDDVEATFLHVRHARPLDRRITSCILGVPRAP